MHRRLIGATLSLALIALLWGDVFAQKDPNNTGAVPKDSDTLTANNYTGVLKTTFNSDRTFTMTVETKKMVPLPGKLGRRPLVIPGAGRAINNLNNALNRVTIAQAAYIKALASAQSSSSSTKKTRSSSKAAARKIQRAANNLQNALAAYQNAALVAGIQGANALAVGSNGVPNFRIDIQKQDYDFQHTENVKVRILELPEQFDEKGNPKPYTDQEKKERKGKDTDLPGYEATPDKLEAGQRVRITLISVPRKKTAPADDKAKKDADKDANANKADADKDKDANANKADADKDGEKKMQVNLVVLLAEADSTKKKKKNDQ